MTLPIERTHAVQAAQTFLEQLFAGEFKRVPKAVRAHAGKILRHYPWSYHLAHSAKVAPEIWGPLE